MDLDLYLSENIDDILDNPDKYVSTENNTTSKKVTINETKNNFKKIQDLEYDDIDEKEYMEYNQDFYNNSYEYYDIDCVDDTEYADDENNDAHNIDEINYECENDDNKNEDNCEDDVLDELYEKMHNSIQPKVNTKELFENPTQLDHDKMCNENNLNSNSNTDQNINLNSDVIENDDGYYFFNLMNIFVKYYNNKFDKTEHFFSNIGNNEKNTTSQMELFYDAIIEFKMMIEHMKLDNDMAMKQLYAESEPEKISSMFEKWDKQIYMFEMGELKLFSPSLIVCLNYVYEKNILNSDWNIYNLRDN